jgi:hypothetical protein
MMIHLPFSVSQLALSLVEGNRAFQNGVLRQAQHERLE